MQTFKQDNMQLCKIQIVLSGLGEKDGTEEEEMLPRWEGQSNKGRYLVLRLSFAINLPQGSPVPVSIGPQLHI